MNGEAEKGEIEKSKRILDTRLTKKDADLEKLKRDLNAEKEKNKNHGFGRTDGCGKDRDWDGVGGEIGDGDYFVRFDADL